MVLIIEIALGIVLGVGLLRLLTLKNFLVLRSFGFLLILCAIGGAIWYALATKRFWVFVVLLVAVLIAVFYDDVRAGNRVKELAAGTRCQQCGNVSLVFKGFRDGYKAKSGHEYDHPIGLCKECGHTQDLYGTEG